MTFPKNQQEGWHWFANLPCWPPIEIQKRHLIECKRQKRQTSTWTNKWLWVKSHTVCCTTNPSFQNHQKDCRSCESLYDQNRRPPVCNKPSDILGRSKKKKKCVPCDFSHLPLDNSIKLINTQPTKSNSQCSPTRNQSAHYYYLNRTLLRRCLHSKNHGIYKDLALSLHPIPRRADGIFCAAKKLRI